MAQDLIYYFEIKQDIYGEKRYHRALLGEVQQGFNMGLTLDGTKDSVHFTIHSFVGESIKPYTIIHHYNTNTWWIVSHDKVSRYMNDTGFLYVHELDCLGCVELLNARDLTDCGFRSNRYSIDDFIKRLLKLSSLEFSSVTINYGSLNKDQKVDYLKTFENYTLLSALREFLNGYNCSPKVKFTVSFNTIGPYIGWAINGMVIDIVSKTGQTSLDTLDIDDFTLVKEEKTIDKNSYGSKVITNANNVVSTKASVFPATGTIKLKSHENITKVWQQDNAVLMLPENAYKVNKVTIIPNKAYIRIRYYKDNDFDYQAYYMFMPYNPKTLENAYQSILGFLTTHSVVSDLSDYIYNNKNFIKDKMRDGCYFDFYDGFLYDPITDTWKMPQNAPSDMRAIYVHRMADAVTPYMQLALTDKTTWQSLAYPDRAMYWERGSNEIKSFSQLNEDKVLGITTPKQIETKYSRLGNSADNGYILQESDDNGNNLELMICGEYNGVQGAVKVGYNEYPSHFIVEYIPMGDLKIVTTNKNETFDYQVYNQSGKMSDSVSLSKLINSYTEEITNDNITRYSNYYDFSDIPQVGQLVDNNGTIYVINNVSLDFHENEQVNSNVEYMIECEFTMSKQIAVKSLMVNANSNIRDYGVPQTNNVARKQVYEDIFYLSNTSSNTYNQGYMTLNNFIGYANIKRFDLKEFVAFIRVGGTFATYSSGQTTPTGTTSYYYYQLHTTRFELKKQILYKVNFNDNNIIGYDSQSIASAFTPARLFDYTSRLLNTPISYVDEKGEVTSIDIAMVDSENTGLVYETYGTQQGYSNDIDLLSGSVFLDPNGDIYGLADTNKSFKISESQYNKDALEIPVFEYSVQLVNSDKVIVGSNAMETYDNLKESDYSFFYGFAYLDDFLGEQSALAYATNEITLSLLSWRLNNSCAISVSADKITISLYEYTTSLLGVFTNHNKINAQSGKTIAIYRYIHKRILPNETYQKEVLFVARDIYVDDNGDINLFIFKR